MARTSSDLGNGQGFVYVTLPDGTTIDQNVVNTGENLRDTLKLLGVSAASLPSNLVSFGSITFTAVSGTKDVRLITIGGIEQMGGPVNVTGLTINQTASAVADNINGFAPISGIDYTAVAIQDTVTIFGTPDSGSTSNGLAITVVVDEPVNVTFTTIAFSGGTDASDIFDSANGYRFFLDSNYGAATEACAGDGTAVEGDLSNSVEVTNSIVVQGRQTATKIEEITIANDAIAPTRKASHSIVEIDTEGGAGTDNIENINLGGFAEGDTLLFRAKDNTRNITFVETGNIVLGAGAFTTAGAESTITIELQFKGGATQVVPTWYEIGRSTQGVSSVTDFRTNLFPFISTEAEGAIATTTGSTVTLTANVSEKFQIVTGATTLSIADFKVFFSTIGAVAGDMFLIKYAAQITEGGGFKVRIGGASAVALTPDMALTGGWFFLGYYNGAAWRTMAFPDMSTVKFALENQFILDGAITPLKLTAEGRTELITIPVSFKTDEVGDHKIVMPYAGTIVEIDHVVRKLIEAADDGSIVTKNNVAAVMSTVSITATSVVGTVFNDTPTSNNTFVAGDIITFTTSKPTAGGKVLISLKITRT